MTDNFSGNRMIAVAFATQSIAIGLTFGTFGLFLEPMERAFAASRADISMIPALMVLIMNLSLPVVGRAFDTRSIRHLMAAGAILNSLALFVVATASSLWQVLIVFTPLISVGTALLGPVAGSTLMANWFQAKRGRALGLVNMGMPAGIMLFAPAASWLIGVLGWRETMIVYATITLVIGLPAAWFGVVNHPRDLGQRPDGAESSAATAPQEDPETSSWTTASVLRRRVFWVMSLSTAVTSGVGVVLGTHLVPYARSMGMSDAAAAGLLSVMAGASLAGVYVLGWLSDRTSVKGLLAASIGIQMIMVAALLASPGSLLLTCAIAVLGLSFGGFMPLLGALIGQHFEAGAFGRVMGMVFLVQLPFVAGASPLGGVIFDRDGSYTALFQVIVLAYAAALVILALLPRPATEVRAQSGTLSSVRESQ